MELTVSCLTQADRKILDYIRSNPEGFLFSSIGQLARQLGVCEATVSRFVRHVGCKDFKELKQTGAAPIRRGGACRQNGPHPQRCRGIYLGRLDGPAATIFGENFDWAG